MSNKTAQITKTPRAMYIFKIQKPHLPNDPNNQLYTQVELNGRQLQKSFKKLRPSDIYGFEQSLKTAAKVNSKVGCSRKHAIGRSLALSAFADYATLLADDLGMSQYAESHTDKVFSAGAALYDMGLIFLTNDLIVAESVYQELMRLSRCNCAVEPYYDMTKFTAEPGTATELIFTARISSENKLTATIEVISHSSIPKDVMAKMCK